MASQPESLAQAQIQSLQISDRELEQLCGVEVSDRFVGGLWGTFRFATIQSLRDGLALLGAELAVGALILILVAVPAGLVAVRFSEPQPPTELSQQVLTVILGSTALGLGSWNVWMLWYSHTRQGLLHLLDERDRFHQILNSVLTAQQLARVKGSAPLHHDLLEILELTRTCLIAGFQTECILRNQQGRLRPTDRSLDHLEHCLARLQTQPLQHEAADYIEIVQQSLCIGQQVQQELEQLQLREYKIEA